jgi:hypothetical protein
MNKDDYYFEDEEEEQIPELADFEGPYVKHTHNHYEDTGFYELLNQPNVWPGDSIHVEPYNQMGREVHRVKHGKDGKKNTKLIEDYYGEYSDPESDFENERALSGFAAITRGENVVPQEADMSYYPFKKMIRGESLLGEEPVLREVKSNDRANDVVLDIFQGEKGKKNTDAMEKYIEGPIKLRRKEVEGNPEILAVFKGETGKNNIHTMKNYMGYNSYSGGRKYKSKNSRRKSRKSRKKKSRKSRKYRKT